jgi:ATP-dependent DNA helicase RecG
VIEETIVKKYFTFTPFNTMKKNTKLSLQWFYTLLERGECDLVDFKEQLEDKAVFGNALRSFAPNYKEMARDVVAFANKKGGFIFIGIADKTKEVNTDFKISDEQKFELVKQIQSLTKPSITILPHELEVENTKILVLEIPFTNEFYCTSKGEYLIRNFDGNKTLEPHELVTVMAEKQQIIYDQKVWKLNFPIVDYDKNDEAIPGWEDIEKLRKLYGIIKKENPKSPFLKKGQLEFAETLGLVKESDDVYFPTTTGLLFIGNERALREIPYSLVNYIRYKSDGTYTPYEYRGNLIDIAERCFNQLKSEISTTEFRFGLFREYVEDYPEVVLRELLINALAHRDYSRQAYIEIRKYDGYLEFESPGGFPDGITIENFLRKSNPRNPNIMDVFREAKFAEKAGSGFDKIFTALLTHGKSLPIAEIKDESVVFRIYADTYTEPLIQLSHQYREIRKQELDMERLLVLNAIFKLKKPTFKDLESTPYLNKGQLRFILKDLEEIEFIETSGKTSDTRYIIHKSKLTTPIEERNYLLNKKQEKQKQIETILRYLEEFGEIDNERARDVLLLPEQSKFQVSRLFKEMIEKQWIVISRREHQKIFYKKILID